MVALPATYLASFPGEIRALLGSSSGSLLFQQTAANLAAEPGADVRVRTGSSTASVRVDGVVDLPFEDSFFQVVGLPPGAGASAPPDNVLIVTPAVFTRLIGTTGIVHQLHVGFDHAGLPASPHPAAVVIQDRANHLQAAVTGGALVGDNLGTVLTQAGEDAQYANLLFLLLGVPALALSAVVAGLVVALRSDRRRREMALLSLRGATSAQLFGLVLAEAAIVAALGALVGVLLAALTARWVLPGAPALSPGWTAAAAGGGLIVALGTQSVPVLRLLGHGGTTGVAAEAARVPATTMPWPLRTGLDLLLLLGAAVAFGLTARSGYHVVLAPKAFRRPRSTTPPSPGRRSPGPVWLCWCGGSRPW